MKPPNRFVKILVVSVFVLLITGFVAYRSGVFMNETRPPGQPAQPEIIKNPWDTTPSFRPDLPPPEKTILPSSKSLSPAIPPLSPDVQDYFILDTTQTPANPELPGADQSGQPDTQKHIGASERTITSSYIYAVALRDNNYRLSDSLIKKLWLSIHSSRDSAKLIPYRNNTSTVLPSSKSGYLFRPRTKPATFQKQRL